MNAIIELIKFVTTIILSYINTNVHTLFISHLFITISIYIIIYPTTQNIPSYYLIVIIITSSYLIVIIITSYYLIVIIITSFNCIFIIYYSLYFCNVYLSHIFSTLLSYHIFHISYYHVHTYHLFPALRCTCTKGRAIFYTPCISVYRYLICTVYLNFILFVLEHLFSRKTSKSRIFLSFRDIFPNSNSLLFSLLV